MSDMNTLGISGNLCADPESHTFDDGAVIAKLRLASNRRISKDKEKTTYVDVEVRGQDAEFALSYMKKGSKVHVTGLLDLDTWDDKVSGQKRSKHRILATTIGFGYSSGKPGGDGGNEGGGAEPAPAKTAKGGRGKKAAAPDVGTGEDIPF